MGLISSKQRAKLPAKEFGLPAEKKYPMPDKNHARVALGRATQMENEGKLSEANAAKVRAKAKKVLGK